MDIVKIASETIEGLFNMRLALPVALVRALTEGLDEVLRKWVFVHSIAFCMHVQSQSDITRPHVLVMQSLYSILYMFCLAVMHKITFVGCYNRSCQNCFALQPSTSPTHCGTVLSFGSVARQQLSV